MAVKKAQRSTRAPFQKSPRQALKNVGLQKQKQVTSVDKKDKKTIVIAQEIKFARLLSCNDKRVRYKVLKSLRKWLTVRSKSSFAFTESDFMRLWKGLFYCMWMSDKFLIQEELAESLSKIIHCFDTKDVVLLYTACTLKTLGTEWFGIDQYRIDKFSMLARRIIRQIFQKCKEKSWDIEWIKGISQIFEKIFTDSKMCLGFTMHLTEVFLEELSKIGGGDIPEDVVTELIKPFVEYFILMDNEKQIKHVLKHIFKYLVFQSDIGMEYKEKFQAWKAAGFPAGSINDIQKIEMPEEEMEDNGAIEEKLVQNKITEKPLDPRAGKVDVELPQIPFDAKQIVTFLAQYKFHPSSTAKSRRQLRHLINQFTELSQGKMPGGLKEVRIPRRDKNLTDTNLAAHRLLDFEKELYSDTIHKKRKRKRNGNILDEHDKCSEEGSENDGAENISKISEINDQIEGTKKKKKVQHKMNAQVSDSNVPNSKERKCKANESNNSNNKVEVNNGNCKVKKDTLLLSKINSNGCKKLKVKSRKVAVSTNVLNTLIPVKRKKLVEVKVGGKWDVSDNTDQSTDPVSVNNSIRSHLNTTEDSVVNESVTKSSIFKEQTMWLVPVLKKLQNEKSKTPSNTLKQQSKINTELNLKKRVKIALQRNTAQHTSEYMLQIRKSPAIPFDANRKPLAGVLKASPMSSPINPFYKKKSFN